MNIQLFIIQQEYLLAENIKQPHSTDYATGFDAGANWLRDYIIKELLCPNSQQQKLEEES